MHLHSIKMMKSEGSVPPQAPPPPPKNDAYGVYGGMQNKSMYLTINFHSKLTG